MIKKVLIIRLSSIGDIVLTTPVVRCLKKQLPHIEIHYLTKPENRLLLASNPYTDQVHVLDKAPWKKALELSALGFDLIIDLHHNLRTAIIKKVMGIPSYAFPKLNIEKFLLVQFKINKLPPVHIVDRYMQCVAPLGVVNDGEGLDFFIPEKDHLSQFEDLNIGKQPYYAWAIGAQHFTKRLPAANIAEGIKKLKLPVILLGGPSDAAMAQEIMQLCSCKVYNACGKTNLNQSAYLVQHCQQLFTNDTGLMHIGAALRKPIVSFWGNTLPAFGMTPYYGQHAIEHYIIENKTLSCRPCSKIGYQTCPKQHFNCMQTLGLDSGNII